MSNAPTETTPDDQTAAEIQRNRRDVIREGFKNKTRGEAWFNGISYIGVGYGLVTAVSVFLTWLMRDTKGAFAKNFERFAEGATKRFGMSRSITSIATLFVGGTLASVFPVKWLEDGKPGIVKTRPPDLQRRGIRKPQSARSAQGITRATQANLAIGVWFTRGGIRRNIWCLCAHGKQQEPAGQSHRTLAG